jgi:hypothetical protein
MNIGASKITLTQEGTGLSISGSVLEDDTGGPRMAEWEPLRTYSIFTKHSWIEPGETIPQDLLLDFGTWEPRTTLLEIRIVCRRSLLSNIEVNADKIVPFDLMDVDKLNLRQRGLTAQWARHRFMRKLRKRLTSAG